MLLHVILPNGDPVRCDRLLCLNLPAPLSQAAIPGKECSPGSGNCASAVSVALTCIQ